MYKRVISLLIVVVFIATIIPFNVFAMDFVEVDPIPMKTLGEKVTVSGTTSLSEVTIRVFNPNSSIVWVDALKNIDSHYSAEYTLDTDPSKVLAGTYTVSVGLGDVIKNITFEVVITATDVAAVITEIPAPAKDETQLKLPYVPDAFSLSIKSSSRTDVIALDGTITPPAVDTAVELILEVTKKSDNSKAVTNPITVVVPAATGEPGDVPVTGVVLNKDKVTLNIGETTTLTAEIQPSNATNQKVSWSTNNPEVATVDENGVVTARKEGTAVITVTTEDGGFTDTCIVTVQKPEVTIKDLAININPETNKMTIEGYISSGRGTDITLKVINPNGVLDYIGQTISGEDGKFTFTFTPNLIKEGKYTIYIGARGIDTPYTIDFEYKGKFVPATGVFLDKKSATIMVGETLKLTATVEPANATNKKVIWSSNNEHIASVDENGVVTAKEEGTAIITVKTEDGGFTDTCNIMVVRPVVPVTGVSLDKKSGTIKVGETLTLTAIVEPANATNKKVTWSSDNEEVATVNGNGVVTARKEGTAVITVTTEDGGFTDTCTITVVKGGTGPIPGGGGGGGGTPLGPTVIVDANGQARIEYITPKRTGNTAIISVPGYLFKDAFDKASTSVKGKKKVLLPVPVVSGAKQYEVELDSNTLVSGNVNNIIEIQTGFATVALSCNMFNTSDVKNNEKIRIVVGEADKSKLNKEIRDQIGNRPVIEIYAMIGNKVVEWNNPDAPVTVSIPYKLGANEDPEHIVVWYIGKDGNPIPVTNGKYDEKTGKVEFVITHFSKYAVAYVKKTFSDLDNYPWAKNAIEVMASKGIIKGTSDTTYNPERNITRADFISLIVRTLGLSAEIDSNFADVKSTDYFYNEVGIAKKLGIVKGIGDNKFNPNEYITRQDMMVMIANALKVAGKISTTGTAGDLKPYKDASEVSGYAVEAVATLIKEGIIKGNDDNTINPLGNATRAEVGVIIYRIYNNY
ncbi:MAG: hypothetical protein GX066_02575 [Clostridiaceae bacterium]|nr:hypothetical protein [Clostridiaceae bacterium]